MISLWIFRLCPSTFHFVFALFSLRNALRFLSMYFPVYICVLKCSIFSEIVQFLLNNLSVISHFVGIQQIAIVKVEAKFIVLCSDCFQANVRTVWNEGCTIQVFINASSSYKCMHVFALLYIGLKLNGMK